MEFKAQLILVILCCVCVNVVNSSESDKPCPENGEEWESDFKNGKRCILRCSDGYVPSGCHVVRPLGNGMFNKGIPICEKAPSVSGKTIAAVGVGVAAVVGAPFALGAAGFTGAGVAAGSLAAWLQGSATATGGLFAASQSAGAAGLAASTQAGIGITAYAVSSYVMDTFTGCESE